MYIVEKISPRPLVITESKGKNGTTQPTRIQGWDTRVCHRSEIYAKNCWQGGHAKSIKINKDKFVLNEGPSPMEWNSKTIAKSFEASQKATKRHPRVWRAMLVLDENTISTRIFDWNYGDNSSSDAYLFSQLVHPMVKQPGKNYPWPDGICMAALLGVSRNWQANHIVSVLILSAVADYSTKFQDSRKPMTFQWTIKPTLKKRRPKNRAVSSPCMVGVWSHSLTVLMHRTIVALDYRTIADWVQRPSFNRERNSKRKEYKQGGNLRSDKEWAMYTDPKGNLFFQVQLKAVTDAFMVWKDPHSQRHELAEATIIYKPVY